MAELRRHRVAVCPHCGDPLEDRETYDWCKNCRAGITCACAQCMAEAIRRLDA